MKYLGIDFGSKRIGVAISDDAGEFAFPKTILPAAESEKALAALCTAEAVNGIVIGESLASNEEENEIQAAARGLGDRLAAATGIPVYYEREDFSSVEAHRYQTTAGARDDSAAAVILQRFLDKKKK